MVESEALSTELTGRWLTGAWLSPAQVGGLRRISLLGEGEGGEVWLSEESSTGRQVALKTAAPEHRDTLAREARALLLAGGQGVPALLGVGEQQGRLCVALELVSGSSLFRANLTSVTFEDLGFRLLEDVAFALVGLHRLGLCHGDVKPDNLLVTDEGRVVLVDLGLSRPAEQPLLGGTPAYLDPALLALEYADPRALDAFALATSVAEYWDPEIRGRTDPGRGRDARLPKGIDRVLRPLLREAPGARPGLDWLLSELGGGADASAAEARIRAAYLDVRWGELASRVASPGIGSVNVSVEGECGALLAQVLELEAVCQNRGEVRQDRGETLVVSNLTPADRSRLVTLVGGPHLSRSPVPNLADQEVLDLLRSAVHHSAMGCVPPALLSVEVAPEGGATPASLEPPTAVDLALGLNRRPVPPLVLDQITRAEGLPERLLLEGARALSRQGQSVRAKELLIGRCQTPEARLLLAELERRSGRRDRARELLGELADSPLPPSLGARRLAQQARLLIDAGRLEEAVSELEGASGDASVHETRALGWTLLRESPKAAREIEQGLLVAEDDEQRARLHGVRGMLEHQLGHAEAARTAFTRARDAAEAASALIEEATYATGLSAAASDAGRFHEALVASERAERIFSALGREADAARAVLGQTSVLALLGRGEESWQRAQRGLRFAESSGDRRCAGFIQLCLADTLEVEGAKRAALAARDLLVDGSPGDRLRVLARLWLLKLPPDADGDALAETVCEAEPRIDWWGARARRAAAKVEIDRVEADLVVGRLVSLSSEAPDAVALGPGLVAGRQLALATGRHEVGRALQAAAQRLARRLCEESGPELSTRAAEIDWVKVALVSGTPGLPAQLSDIESLLRALSQRQGLRDLLRQSLDLLLLWTGVERGMILLSAPEGRLVVRAARNLAHEDLSEEQLALSRSMAERALIEGRPIVTVDAQRDPGEYHKSAHALRLRSILSVPLVAHGEVLGVAYLDDRVRPGAFGEKELAWSQLIATVTALAVSEERNRLKLRRAVRRASRAEAKLEQELVRTKGELEVTARELSKARREVFLQGDYSDIIGRGSAMSHVLQLVDRIAPADVPVLITGESGTGKELIARAIGRSSSRKDGPFVVENCAAVPETLLESTLFGHQRGAFTGATKDQPGLLVLSDRGTLFLDEIGEMTLGMQAKLLRVLQDGEVKALGASRSRKVDVRLICATHRDLARMVEAGTFREDLYYRLNVVPIALPPLRERAEDIDPLVDFFVKRYDPHGRRSVSPAVRERFRTFSWPGNVRQMENEIRRMLLLGGRDLTLADVSPALRGAPETPEGRTLRDKLNDLERQLVIEALEAHRGNRTRAAEALGISRFGLQKMMQRLAIASH